MLGVVTFALFGMLVWVYRDGKQTEKHHRAEMKELLSLYQEKNENMAKIVEQSTSTIQTLINSLQITEVIEETIKEAINNAKND